MDSRRRPQPMFPGPRGGPMMGAFGRPQDARRTTLRLLRYLHPHRATLAGVLLLMMISTGSMLAGNYFLKPLINNAILPGDFRALKSGLITLGAIYLTGVFAAYFQNRLMVRIAQTTSNTLRRELFVKMQRLPLKFFDAHPHGELMSRCTNDVDNVQVALEQSLIQLISSVFAFTGVVVLMIVLSPTLFAVTLSILALMFFLSAKIAGKSRTNFQAQQRDLGRVNSYIEEIVGGLKVVKVFTHESETIAEFKRRNEAYRQSAATANFYAGVVMPLMSNLNNIAYAAVALVGGALVIGGRFDIGSLAAFLQFSRNVGMPVQQITNQLTMLLSALAGAERVFAVMDEVPEEDDGVVTLVGVGRNADGSLSVNADSGRAAAWAWKVPQPDGSAEYVELRGDVRFEDVTFGYLPEKTVLERLSLFARPGQKIAFVGSTGAGKTTIANLLNRFYDIAAGKITYDGIEIQRIRKDDLRRSLGMVLQDTHLFTGTILDNIRYGRLDASDADCIRAAVRVNADSFIRRLPDGYHTRITADGGSLSQGQRQLLAIARAAVADPPVMILDEATSSIDTRTERLIEQGMDALMKDRTVFVIAHRLSTVRNANAILVLEDGQIIERGDHADLLEQRGRYYRLYTGQSELS